MLPMEKLLLERIPHPQAKSSLLAAPASATPHRQSSSPPPDIMKPKVSHTPASSVPSIAKTSDPTQQRNWAPSTAPISSEFPTPRVCHWAAAASTASRSFPGKCSSSPSTSGDPGWPCPVPSPRASRVTCRVAGQAGRALGCGARPWEASPLLPRNPPGTSIYAAPRRNPGGGKGEAGKPPRCWAGPARCLSCSWCWFSLSAD